MMCFKPGNISRFKGLIALLLWPAFFGIFSPDTSLASSGTEAAAFLDIPVGGAPAALGSAYTALATDAYAPTWNPAGLGILEGTELAGQHLAYLDSIHYEYLSFVHSFDNRVVGSHAIGASVQYLGTGDIAGTDNFGNSIGNFSSHYAAYSLAYGRSMDGGLSLGLTGKLINAAISNLSANAYAVDFGSMYRCAEDRLTLAATVNNLGTSLNLLNHADPLPLAFKIGAAYRPSSRWVATTEGVYEKSGLLSGHLGIEWKPISALALRVGYRTDTIKELSALAGLTTGLGIDAWGHEFAYAWVPLGDLGSTHYFSMVLRFGEKKREKQNLIFYQKIKKHRTVEEKKKAPDEDPDYQQLMQLLSDDERRLAVKKNPNQNVSEEAQ